VSGWLARRALQAVVTYLLAATLAFVVMRLTPGDPLARLTEDRPLPPDAIAALRARYQLDQPILRQYATFLGGALRGDLGRSIEHQGSDVVGLIRERLPATLLLGATVLLLNFSVGIGLGVWGGVGLLVLTVVFGVAPTAPPVPLRPPAPTRQRPAPRPRAPRPRAPARATRRPHGGTA
jgi:peptide/nickel transport system permease protein/oligopeptide transport system permease protein